MFAYVEKSAAMVRRISDPSSTTEVKERLRITRLALGHTQATMGLFTGAGSPAQAWQNYESPNNLRRIPIEAALKLCAATGVSLPWIYQGNLQSLPADLMVKVQLQIEIERELHRASKA